MDKEYKKIIEDLVALADSKGIDVSDIAIGIGRLETNIYAANRCAYEFRIMSFLKYRKFITGNDIVGLETSKPYHQIVSELSDLAKKKKITQTELSIIIGKPASNVSLDLSGKHEMITSTFLKYYKEITGKSIEVG